MSWKRSLSRAAAAGIIQQAEISAWHSRSRLNSGASRGSPRPRKLTLPAGETSQPAHWIRKGAKGKTSLGPTAPTSGRARRWPASRSIQERLRGTTSLSMKTRYSPRALAMARLRPTTAPTLVWKLSRTIFTPRAASRRA